MSARFERRAPCLYAARIVTSRRGVFFILLVVSSLFSACSSKETPAKAKTSLMDVTPAPAPGMGVSGTSIDIRLTEGGEVSVPDGPDKLRVAALVPNSAGGFTVLTGTVNEDGTFVVPVVPAGLYYLRREYSDGKGGWELFDLVATSERVVHLGSLYTGRPDVTWPQLPTPLSIAAENLSPWKAEDQLELFSLGADTTLFIDGFRAEGQLHEGDTRTGALAVDLAHSGMSLVDGEHGDRVTLTNLVSAMAGPMTYQTVAGSFDAAPFTLMDGQAATIAGSFAPTAQHQLSITWNQAAFAALASDVNAKAQAQSHSIWVYAEPAGQGRHAIASSPTVLSGYLDAQGESMDQRFDFDYGNPFPAAWPLVANVSTEFVLGQDPYTRWGFIEIWGTLDAMASAAVVPPISPPRVLRIAGPSLTPKISWDAPALGTPAAYFVQVYLHNGSDGWELPLWLWTQERSVTFPPGLLRARVPYYVSVQAVTTYDPKHPYSRPPAGAAADALSDVITP